jgi:hypothetical protein
MKTIKHKFAIVNGGGGDGNDHYLVMVLARR